MGKTTVISLVSALVGFYAAGCTMPHHSTFNAEGPRGVFKPASGHDVSSIEYRVDPPDVIIIKSPQVKELDGASQTVRNDGKIALNLLGEVQVNGKTPSEIVVLLREKLKPFYASAELRIEVIANSKFYHVFGLGAGSVGKKVYTGNNSILSAMSDAQVVDGGWPEQVTVSRPARGGQPAATAIINFDKIMKHADMSQNYALEEGDIIYVPLDPLTSLSRNITKISAPITGGLGLYGSSNVVRSGSNNSVNSVP